MKQNTQFKILIAATFSFVLFSSLAVYSFYKAFESDPEVMSKIQVALQKNTNSHINFSFKSDDADGPFDSSNASWTFSGKTEQIKIESINGDIEIATTDGEEIKVNASGDFSKKPGKQLIKTNFLSNQLTIEQPDDGSVKKLKVNVYLPKSFANDVTVRAVSGNILITKVSLNKLKAETVSGDINVEADGSKNLELNSVSGNINLNVKNPELLKVETQTISGKININPKKSNQGSIPVKLQTVSGDITLQ